jgi:hypothetical protein
MSEFDAENQGNSLIEVECCLEKLSYKFVDLLFLKFDARRAAAVSLSNFHQ